MTSGATPAPSPGLAMQMLDERALDGSVSTVQYFRWRALAHSGLDGAAQVIEAVKALPRPVVEPVAAPGEGPGDEPGTADQHAPEKPRSGADEESTPSPGPAQPN